MRLTHALAAAAIAVCGVVLAPPAEAAPKGEPPVAGPAGPAGSVILAGDRDRDHDRNWRRGDRDDRHWRRDRDDRRGWRDDRHRRHGDWDRSRGRHFGWDRGRGHDRDWRDDRRRHGDWDRSRGRHFGWDRGRGHDRDWRGDRRHDKHKRWEKKRKRWHARPHPRHRYWHGRQMSRGNYVVVRDYDRYQLPRPRRGQFYARAGDDVFLVSEATRRIIDAFVLRGAIGRY